MIKYTKEMKYVAVLTASNTSLPESSLPITIEESISPVPADIVTPNLTELYLLTGEHDIKKGTEILLESGVSAVVVTGINKNNEIGNAVFEKGRSEEYFAHPEEYTPQGKSLNHRNVCSPYLQQESE